MIRKGVIIAGSVFFLLACSCVNREAGSGDVNSSDSTRTSVLQALPFDNAAKSDTSQGVIGIFYVPEMQCLSILDSAKMRDISAKVTANYTILQEELIATGSEMDGAPGQILYNNDPDNFKFECIIPVKKISVKQPARCRIVVLKDDDMLVYNYYGHYRTLYIAYDSIRNHLAASDLVSTGPMREFYITDASQVKDPDRWMTRIMIPVIRKNQ
jgi:effector-binding domain-containing protein